MLECVIERFHADKIQPLIKGGSSKGLQTKYYSDGFWYKKDSVGYESLAEVLASRAIHLTNANLVLVDYSPVYIVDKLTTCRGCKSKSFLVKGDTEFTLAHIMEKQLGLHYRSDNFPAGTTLLSNVVCCLRQFKNSQKLCDQLSCLLQLDRLVLNVDRHLHNVVLIEHEDSNLDLISFDNGDSLAADITFDFDEHLSYRECVTKAYARPFSSSFDKQCEMLKEYSPFSLQVKQSALKVSDLTEFIPSQVFKRMLDILSYTFNKYLDCNLEFI